MRKKKTIRQQLADALQANLTALEILARKVSVEELNEAGAPKAEELAVNALLRHKSVTEKERQ